MYWIDRQGILQNKVAMSACSATENKRRKISLVTRLQVDQPTCTLFNLETTSSHFLPEDVNVSVGACVGGEDVVVRNENHTLTVPHLQAEAHNFPAENMARRNHMSFAPVLITAHLAGV